MASRPIIAINRLGYDSVKKSNGQKPGKSQQGIKNLIFDSIRSSTSPAAILSDNNTGAEGGPKIWLAGPDRQLLEHDMTEPHNLLQSLSPMPESIFVIETSPTLPKDNPESIDVSYTLQSSKAIRGQQKSFDSQYDTKRSSIIASSLPVMRSAKKLKREATVAYFREHARAPDLTKIYSSRLKESRTYNRLSSCDITLFHPGRQAKLFVPGTIAENISVRIAVGKDNLKIAAVLRQQDPGSGDHHFYNLASLNWHISSLQESQIGCFVDKMEGRRKTSKGRWQYNPTYFFEVRNQGKIERSYLDSRVHKDISNSQLQVGYETILAIRDKILQSLQEQQNAQKKSNHTFWMAIHALNPQTDDDDTLKQLFSDGSKFEFTSWQDVPDILLEGALRNSLMRLQKDIRGDPDAIISGDVVYAYQESLCHALKQDIQGIPLLRTGQDLWDMIAGFYQGPFLRAKATKENQSSVGIFDSSHISELSSDYDFLNSDCDDFDSDASDSRSASTDELKDQKETESSLLDYEAATETSGKTSPDILREVVEAVESSPVVPNHHLIRDEDTDGKNFHGKFGKFLSGSDDHPGYHDQSLESRVLLERCLNPQNNSATEDNFQIEQPFNVGVRLERDDNIPYTLGSCDDYFRVDIESAIEEASAYYDSDDGKDDTEAKPLRKDASALFGQRGKKDLRRAFEILLIGENGNVSSVRKTRYSSDIC